LTVFIAKQIRIQGYIITKLFSNVVAPFYMVSEEVRQVFEMPLIDKVWAALEKIGMDTKILAANFNGYYKGRRRTDPLLQPRHIFIEWGEDQLEPLINRKLHRDPSHPTFGPLMNHCLKQEIENRRAQYSGRGKSS
jgi:hypothetical protein